MSPYAGWLTPTTKETPMAEPQPLPAPHDCDEFYDAACPVCTEDEADEPDCSPYGIMTVEPDGTKRPATGREAAHWAREMVKAGILPKDHPSITHVRRLRRRHLALFWTRNLTAGAAGAAVGALLPAPPIDSTVAGILVLAAAALYVVWLFTLTRR